MKPSGEKKASTPKRRRSLLAGEGSPNAVPTTPKTPGGTRLTERQQMALLMQMTAGEGHVQGSGSGEINRVIRAIVKVNLTGLSGLLFR